VKALAGHSQRARSNPPLPMILLLTILALLCILVATDAGHGTDFTH
jgi:hypothetical protein